MAQNITKPTTTELRRLAAVFFPTDEDYRARLFTTYGVRSTLDLSEKQGREIIDDVRRELGHAPRNARTAAKPHPSGREHWTRCYHGGGSKEFAHRLTPKQAREIARLEDVLGWTADPKRLTGFVARTLRLQAPITKTPSMLTKAEATDLLTALTVPARQ